MEIQILKREDVRVTEIIEDGHTVECISLKRGYVLDADFGIEIIQKIMAGTIKAITIDF